ncbi:MAG: hypothetical protein ABIW16_04595 [Sphingomicrobium sp.]
MAASFALAEANYGLRRWRLPERIPDLKKPWLILFQLLWFPALLLAIVGPVAGTWSRLTTAGENSGLMLGSRAGLALDEDDLTKVRFPIGDIARTAGVTRGDDIVAINGVPVARKVPISPAAMARPNDATDSDYALFAPVISGTDPVDLEIQLKGADGKLRTLTIQTGERYIEQDAAKLGLAPWMLSIIDLLHLLTYPFLLFAAWILHRRKREDLISSILSLAILLTMAAEQPSATFLTFVAQVPDWLHQRIYDLGNICLLAGILLFPFGWLRPRAVIAFIAALPLLFFLQGDPYRLTFMLFMGACVLTLLVRLRRTEPGDAEQQIKWALFGFTGYALFLTLALALDMTKLSVGGFGTQLLFELLGGLSFGLAFLTLQLGLLVALLRFRLYDAESVISRSANVALITLVLGGIFAATSEGVKELILTVTGKSAGAGPTIFAAAVATLLVNPAQERISRWSEQWFQRDLVKLRDDLPDCIRDMRETAALDEIVETILIRIEDGVRTTHVAAIIGGKVVGARGATIAEVETWLAASNPEACADGICEIADKTFPIRVPLTPAHGDGKPIGFVLIGPRPDGTLLSKDEQETLVEVADPIARALRNVIKREKRETELARLIARHERRIEELEALVAPAKPARSA